MGRGVLRFYKYYYFPRFFYLFAPPPLNSKLLKIYVYAIAKGVNYLIYRYFSNFGKSSAGY